MLSRGVHPVLGARVLGCVLVARLRRCGCIVGLAVPDTKERYAALLREWSGGRFTVEVMTLEQARLFTVADLARPMNKGVIGKPGLIEKHSCERGPETPVEQLEGKASVEPSGKSAARASAAKAI